MSARRLHWHPGRAAGEETPGPEPSRRPGQPSPIQSICLLAAVRFVSSFPLCISSSLVNILTHHPHAFHHQGPPSSLFGAPNSLQAVDFASDFAFAFHPSFLFSPRLSLSLSRFVTRFSTPSSAPSSNIYNFFLPTNTSASFMT
ncbi:hypothetical protein JDV02_002705 [Purpureocillium takamizusanense]|uniref:Uncharacterized protein n=1 Tax=Purpureocillium takamizusanense TaxID=2060973 RepID=A0A9Q8V936_9HYPO|nr:uncharacterized protein JDV02_002705 [Purpureocillium takamizusanense]UNI16251.1 hypothetical protein JDV02_002705 [Purpureocillium takamizusanense]